MNEAQPNNSSQEKTHPVEKAPIFGLRNDTGSFAEKDEGEILLKAQAKKVSDAKAFLKAIEEQGVNPELNPIDVALSIKRAKAKRDEAQTKLELLQKEVAKKRGYS